jgi:hypothetical protein
MPLCRSCHHAYDGRAANLPHHQGETHPQAKLTEAVVRQIRPAVQLVRSERCWPQSTQQRPM